MIFEGDKERSKGIINRYPEWAAGRKEGYEGLGERAGGRKRMSGKRSGWLRATLLFNEVAGRKKEVSARLVIPKRSGHQEVRSATIGCRFEKNLRAKCLSVVHWPHFQ